MQIGVIRYLSRLKDIDESGKAVGKVLQVAADGETHEYVDPSLPAFADHSFRHEAGGPDEISVHGLLGVPAALQAHLDDATDAHDASAISFVPAGSIVATDVQAAIEEVAALDGAVILAPGDSARNVIQPTDAAAVPLTVKGAAAQTANLQDWRNSADALLGQVSAAGQLKMFAQGASDVPFVAKGAVNHSGNLLELRNSAEAILLGAGPRENGSIMLLTTPVSEMRVEQTGDTFGATRLRLVNRTGNNGAILENAGLDLVDLAFSGSTAATRSIRYENRAGSRVIDTQPEFQIGPSGFQNATLFVSDRTTLARSNLAAAQALIVRGAASQSEDLQQWQDSAGTVLSRVSPAGWLTIGQTADPGTAPLKLTDGVNSLTSTRFVIHAPWNTVGKNVGFLFERTDGSRFVSLWTGSSAAVLGYTAGADLYVGSYAFVDRDSSALPTDTSLRIQANGSTRRISVNSGTAPSAGLHVFANEAAVPTVIVQGATSQSADLTQWKDSGGTAFASVGPERSGSSALGTFVADRLGDWTPGFVARDLSAIWHLGLTPASGGVRGLALGGHPLNTSWSWMLTWLNGPGNRFKHPNTSQTGQPIVSVEATASQSADIQQWKDSALTVLAAIGSGGWLEMLEQATPATPAANRVRWFARDNGSGVTQVVVVFPSGNTVVIAEDF